MGYFLIINNDLVGIHNHWKYKQLLYDFFKSQTDQFWPKDQTIIFDNKTFTFKHDIFLRKNLNKKCYEILSNKLLGYGGFSTVKLINNTARFDQLDDMFSKKEKNRKIVKIQPLIKHYKTPVLREYEVSHRTQHLKIKPPTFSKQGLSYTRMDRIRGVELTQFLNKFYSNSLNLNSIERIKICKALLLKLKSQITDLRLMHRDIKPCNILIDYDYKKATLDINFIDYGFSLERPDGVTKGTPPYIAPESYVNPKKITYKIDIYSMGMIFGLIWNGLNEAYNNEIPNLSNFNDFFNDKKQSVLNSLFKNISDLDNASKKCIGDLISSMLEVDPGKRISVDDAISFLNSNTKELYKSISYNISLQKFHTLHAKLRSHEIFSFFRRTSIKGNEDLATILEHAKICNNRSRVICVKLGWLNKNGTLHIDAPHSVKQAFLSKENNHHSELKLDSLR